MNCRLDGESVRLSANRVLAHLSDPLGQPEPAAFEWERAPHGLPEGWSEPVMEMFFYPHRRLLLKHTWPESTEVFEHYEELIEICETQIDELRDTAGEKKDTIADLEMDITDLEGRIADAERRIAKLKLEAPAPPVIQ